MFFGLRPRLSAERDRKGLMINSVLLLTLQGRSGFRVDPQNDVC